MPNNPPSFLRLSKKIKLWLSTFGFNWDQFVLAKKGYKQFRVNAKEIRSQIGSLNPEFPISKYYPCLSDRFKSAGTATGHYFHQDLYVARRVFTNQPMLHVDVGSRMDGFVAHVASYRSIFVFDIRPVPDISVPNITFRQLDLMQELDPQYANYCDSLSCLHALEHFGLGRYGDEVNVNGYLDGLNNLYKILKPEGRLYLSVPIGKQRIEFDAHRVFSVEYLISLFEGRFEIDRFSYVNNQGNFNEDVELSEQGISTDFGCSYGCGIFELIKVDS